MRFFFFKPQKIGLVLGGGVSHGIAHVGVLKAVDKYKIPIDYIAATSSGALVGAAYAAGLPIKKIEEIALALNWLDLIKINIFREGFVTTGGIQDILKKSIGDLEFKDLKIPFVAVGTCLRRAEACILDHGKVAPAVGGVSAFPGIFSPVMIENHLVADGGIAGNQLPVDAVKKMGADFVIASDVVPINTIPDLSRKPLDVFERSLNIIMHRLSVPQMKKADILVQPQIEEDLWSFDENKARRMIDEGERVALKALRKIRQN
jgi:NTE family protein